MVVHQPVLRLGLEQALEGDVSGVRAGSASAASAVVATSAWRKVRGRFIVSLRTAFVLGRAAPTVLPPPLAGEGWGGGLLTLQL